MKTIWTNDLKDPESKLALQQALQASPHLQKLRDILKAKEQDLTSVLISTPSDDFWAYKQAHINGRLFDLKETLELLNF